MQEAQAAHQSWQSSTVRLNTIVHSCKFPMLCLYACCVLPENGPYHINEDLSLERSEYGWDVNSNMIFVDQPINTGFSYSDVGHLFICMHVAYLPTSQPCFSACSTIKAFTCRACQAVIVLCTIWFTVICRTHAIVSMMSTQLPKTCWNSCKPSWKVQLHIVL